MRQVINAQRLAAQRFYLVLLPEDGHPQREEFDNVEDMVDRIRTLIDETAEVSIFPFMGNFLPITQGPSRFLVTPYGSLPLFQLPDPSALVLEEHGYVGPPETDLPAPETSVDPVAQARLFDEETTAPTETSQGNDDDDETPTMQGMPE